METKNQRWSRIERQMKALREKERALIVDQSQLRKYTLLLRNSPEMSLMYQSGWSAGMTWQELLDARAYPNINAKNL